MSDGRLMIVLGDVTGHGIGPALLAAACRAYARSSFAVHPDLFAAMTQINARVSRDLDPSRFVTFVGVACSSSTGELEILSAGHGPLLLYSALENSFREIDSQGVPLGILDRKSTRLNSSHPSISYAVFCLKKKKLNTLIS